MVAHHFTHVRSWVFDLDNTLYCPSCRLFDQIDRKMTDYVMRTLNLPRPEADKLRHDYWQAYGTTLAGLIEHHGVDPEPYLVEVHDITFDTLVPDPDLAARIRDLSGRRIVYTNGSAPYAERVLEARGLTGLFDAIYGVEHAGYLPKPHRAAFEAIFAADKLDPASAAMFEDDPRNLAAPHELGMRTIHVAPVAVPANHIHHHTDDLTGFLSLLAK